MTPASNSEARKRGESRPTTVLVEIPIDVAERAIAAARAGLHDASGDEIDALIGVLDRVADALGARVPATPIGDQVRPDAVDWAGRH